MQRVDLTVARGYNEALHFLQPSGTSMDPSAQTSGSSSTGGFRALPVLSRAAKRPRSFPSWIKARFSDNERYRFLQGRLREHGLHTVCEEAECPNIGECWAHGTATFMLLLSAMLLIGNIIADLLLVALDPRVRQTGRAAA